MKTSEVGSFFAGGWVHLISVVTLKAMTDCKYQPKPGDRRHYLKVNWDEELSHFRLQKIKDKKIRITTYFTNQVIEHTQRLRSMAMFVERVGPLQGKGGMLYNLWSKNAALKIMLEESIEMGKEKESELIQQLCKANDNVAQLFLEIEWDQETASNLTDQLMVALKEKQQRKEKPFPIQQL